jgi:peptidoglycan hydrolase-like protein with peptidoglycan-binding domain
LNSSKSVRVVGMVVGTVVAVGLLASCGSTKKVTAPNVSVASTATTLAAATTAAPTTLAPVTTKPATTAPAPPASVAIPPGYVKESDTGTLVYLMAGPRVAAVQKKLKALGFDPGPVDGAFGDQTDKVVKAFQTSKSLVADGGVGPQTSAAIDAACAKATC